MACKRHPARSCLLSPNLMTPAHLVLCSLFWQYSDPAEVDHNLTPVSVCRLEPWLEQWDELKEASCNAYSSYDNAGPEAQSGSPQNEAAQNGQASVSQQPGLEPNEADMKQDEPEKQDPMLDNEQERMQRSSTAQRPKNSTSLKQAWDDAWGRLSYRCACQMPPLDKFKACNLMQPPIRCTQLKEKLPSCICSADQVFFNCSACSVLAETQSA